MLSNNALKNRQCRVCGETKLTNQFPVNRPDGSKRWKCKACQAQAYRERYQADAKRRALQIAYSMNGTVQRRFPQYAPLEAEQLAQLVLETSSCRYCRLPNTQSGQGFQLDHVVPLSKGGTHELQNVAL